MIFLKKFSRVLLSLSISGIILYAELLFSFPSEIVMLENENHHNALGAGVFIGDIPKSICAWDGKSGIKPLKSGEYEATLRLANAIPFKKVTLKITQAKTVCASGELIGLRIYNKGLIVTGTEPIKSDSMQSSPAKEAGIEKGDIILEINGTPAYRGEDVPSLLTKETTLTIMRNNSIKKIALSPLSDNSGNLKLGVWVRDSTAGVGTMTYFNPENGSYGALGHAISDSDTGVLFDVGSGTIEKSRVLSVRKGESGNPGEICGSFSHNENSVCGTVDKNCEAGIFGNILPSSSFQGKSYPIGVMSQVKEGKATILSTVNEKIEEYDIMILRAMPFGSATKGLMIEITDAKLLNLTGGIIQGMSGSPIVQNGKLVGAVTHVFVNDPTRGYGIFIENMLTEAEKIK